MTTVDLVKAWLDGEVSVDQVTAHARDLCGDVAEARGLLEIAVRTAVRDRES